MVAFEQKQLTKGDDEEEVKPQAMGVYNLSFSSGQNRRSEHRQTNKRRIEDYGHYAAIVIDDEGNCLMLSSSSLKRHKRAVLSDAAIRIQEVLVQAQKPEQAKAKVLPKQRDLIPSPPQQHWQPSISYPFHSKKRRVSSDDSEIQYACEAASDQTDYSALPRSQLQKSLSTKKELVFPQNHVVIRLDETARWQAWFADGFTLIQQTACRTIAKEWIKVIHPKKQSTHPYNGKVPRNMGDNADPERTRPPYWPPDVRHKEPDHIDKAARTTLLVHLLMRTPLDEIVPDKTKSDKIFLAKDLLAALKKKQDEGVTAKWPILQELIEVRVVLENRELGGADDDVAISVPDWGEVLRATSTKKKHPGTQANQVAESDEDHVCDNQEDSATETTEEATQFQQPSQSNTPLKADPELKHEIFYQPPPQIIAPGPSSKRSKGAAVSGLTSRNPDPHHSKGFRSSMEARHVPCSPIMMFPNAHGSLCQDLHPSAGPGYPFEVWGQIAPNSQNLLSSYDDVISMHNPAHMGQTFANDSMHLFHAQTGLDDMILASSYASNPEYMLDNNRTFDGGYLCEGVNHLNRVDLSAQFGQDRVAYHSSSHI